MRPVTGSSVSAEPFLFITVPRATRAASSAFISTAPASAVFVLIDMERAAPVAPNGFPRLRDPIHPRPTSHDALYVFCGSRPADLEQPLFGLRRGHASERADLRVRQLTAGQRSGQQRQHAERPRHANPLAGGARVEPDAPRQPRGAGAEAVAPAAAEVEVADEIEQPSGRGVVMGGQLGDVIAKALELWSVHRRVSPVICCADSTPGFSTAPRDARTRDRRATRNFSADTTRRLA